MSNTVLLNNINHKNLCVITEKSAELGHNIGSSLVFPTEFMQVQREYPILFYKAPNAEKYQSIALFGFRPKENLFLTPQGWNASYIPSVLNKGPFLIGYQNQMVDYEEQRKEVVHVDMNSPLISESKGERVFLDNGSASPYFDYIQSLLQQINDGVQIEEKMFAAFTQLDLIQPMNLNVEVTPEHRYNLPDFYTINASKLAQLEGEQLSALHKAGFLQSAHMVVASLNNIQKLINMQLGRLIAEQQAGVKV